MRSLMHASKFFKTEDWFIHPQFYIDYIDQMSSLSTEISYYLSIAIDINKRIGGKRGYGIVLSNLRGWSKRQGQVLIIEG